LLAGLLLFRLLYYVIPFVISLAILGIREAVLSRQTRRLTHAPPLPRGAASRHSRDKIKRARPGGE
jgi:hypothetical protein